MVTVGVRGGLSVDHLVVDGQGAVFEQLGGPALFAALGARLVAGVDVGVMTSLPEDDARFAELFDEYGIDRGSSRSVPAATRLWILNSDQGRRIVEVGRTSAVEIDGALPAPREEEEQPWNDAFVAGLEALLDSAPLRAQKVNARTRVGIDPHQGPMQGEGMDYLRRVVPFGGVVLPSRVQLCLIDLNPRDAARQISRELESPVIARLDGEGMLVVEGSREHTVRDDSVHLVETTGAGDASAAAIMAALALGADMVTAAMFGVSVARVALAGWGATSLLTQEPLSTPFHGVTATQERL